LRFHLDNREEERRSSSSSMDRLARPMVLMSRERKMMPGSGNSVPPSDRSRIKKRGHHLLSLQSRNTMCPGRAKITSRRLIVCSCARQSVRRTR
jgi:hypothetical protein